MENFQNFKITRSEENKNCFKVTLAHTLAIYDFNVLYIKKNIIAIDYDIRPNLPHHGVYNKAYILRWLSNCDQSNKNYFVNRIGFGIKVFTKLPLLQQICLLIYYFDINEVLLADKNEN